LRPPNQAGASIIHLVIVRVTDRILGDKDQIPPGSDHVDLDSHSFPQSSFDQVAGDRIANTFADGKAKSTVGQVVGQIAEHKQPIAGCLPFAPNFLKLPIAAKPITAIHTSL